ncbi:MAG: hypothetical protein VKO39_13020 [Cyanobacteriota bacterium]|nr:hypothetical protein [Cyanobacteriota bacterium]
MLLSAAPPRWVCGSRWRSWPWRPPCWPPFSPVAGPFELVNLSFQFDAPLLATAQLLAIAAAGWGCRVGKDLEWRRLLPQTALLVLSLGLDQPAFGLDWVVMLSQAALPWLRLSSYAREHAAVASLQTTDRPQRQASGRRPCSC